MKKPTKWGTPGNRTIEQVEDWYVGTREFVCDDGTMFWQYKIARNMWSFTDPLASGMGWVSKPARRHGNDEFANRECAKCAARAAIEGKT